MNALEKIWIEEQVSQTIMSRDGFFRAATKFQLFIEETLNSEIDKSGKHTFTKDEVKTLIRELNKIAG